MGRKFLIFSLFAFLFSFTAKSAYAICFGPNIPNKIEVAAYTILSAALVFSIFFISKELVSSYAVPASKKKQPTKSLKSNRLLLTLGFSIVSLGFVYIPMAVILYTSSLEISGIALLGAALLIGAIKGIRWGIGAVVFLLVSYAAWFIFTFAASLERVFQPQLEFPMFAISAIIICLFTFLATKMKSLNLLLGMILLIFAWNILLMLIYQMQIFYFPPDLTGCGLPIIE